MMTRTFFPLVITFFFFLMTLAPSNNVNAIELTAQNWEEQTAGEFLVMVVIVERQVDVFWTVLH